MTSYSYCKIQSALVSPVSSVTVNMPVMSVMVAYIIKPRPRLGRVNGK